MELECVGFRRCRSLRVVVLLGVAEEAVAQSSRVSPRFPQRRPLELSSEVSDHAGSHLSLSLGALLREGNPSAFF